MNETMEKVTEETTKEEKIMDIINSIVDKMMMEEFGITEKTLELCPKLLSKIDRAIGAIRNGEKEQREVAISFFENLERIGIVKPGTALNMKDSCYNFDPMKFHKNDNNKAVSKDKTPIIKEHIIEVPQEQGISKEEFEKNIMQKIQEKNAGIAKDIKDAIVKAAWESYQRNVESDQEDNSNV